MPRTASRCSPDTCQEHIMLRAKGESRKERAKWEADPAVTEKQANRGRGPDGTGGAQPTWRPLGARGGLSSYVPRPGPLQRRLHAESSEDACHKKHQTSGLSSCPRRNAITSSYNYTRSFPPAQRTRGPATFHAGLFQLSSKKVSQEGPPSSSAASGLTQKKCQPAKDGDVTKPQKQTQRNGSPTRDSSRPRKRKVALLPRR